MPAGLRPAQANRRQTMELNTSQIATQAAAQASALASLQLLRKTLELQAANASGK